MLFYCFDVVMYTLRATQVDKDDKYKKQEIMELLVTAKPRCLCMYVCMLGNEISTNWQLKERIMKPLLLLNLVGTPRNPPDLGRFDQKWCM